MILDFVWEFRGAGPSILVLFVHAVVVSLLSNIPVIANSVALRLRCGYPWNSQLVLRVWIGSGNPQLVMRVWIGSGGVSVSMRTCSVYGTCSFACTGHGVLVTSGAVADSRMVSTS